MKNITRLEKMRTSKKLSREILAEMSGVDARTIYRIEKESDYSPSVKSIKAIAKALETTQAYLAGEIDNPSIDVGELRGFDLKNLWKLYPIESGQFERLIEDQFADGKTVDKKWLIDSMKEMADRKQRRLHEQMMERPWNVYLRDLPIGAGKVTVDNLDNIETIGQFTLIASERVDYAGRVKGTSMEPLIHNNALLFVQSAPPAIVDDGDIAIIYDGFEMDLMVRKVWFHDRVNYIEIGIQSLNPDAVKWQLYKDRIDESRSCPIRILGKVVKWENLQDKIDEHLKKVEDIIKE